MATLDENGNLICACGKREADGVRCILGATHERLKKHALPWEITREAANGLEKSFPWTPPKEPWQ